MNSVHKPRPVPRSVTAAAALVLTSGLASAAPFLYSPGDLLLAFRLAGNASDLIVNLGSATNYQARAQGETVPVTRLDASQLTAVFADLGGVSWSVAGASRPPGVPEVPLQTLWVTAPRLDPATPAPAWLRKGQFVQGNAASRIDAVGLAAAAWSSGQPAGPLNTAGATAVPSTGDYALSPLLGAEGDYAGSFQGLVEAVTSADFATAAETVSRADLYELVPGTSAAGTLDQPGRRLGFFELKPDGSLTFNTTRPEPPSPRITAISRAGDRTTISFTTVAGASYRLRRVDASGLTDAISGWTAGASVAGTGSIASLEDTAADGARFYRIEVTP